MKKLLLLSAFLIFACSSEDNTNSQNPEQNTKLLKTYTTVDAECAADASDWIFYYDAEGRLTEAVLTDWLSDCPSIGWDDWVYDEPYNRFYIYNNNSIQITDTGYGDTWEILINEDGTFADDGYTFNNGYIEEIINLSNNGYLYEWTNGNLIEVQRIENNELVNERYYTYEYTEYENNTPVFNPEYDLLWVEQLDLQILGCYGKNSKNLPSRYERLNGSYKSVETFSYIFDEDNYPEKIISIITDYIYDDQLEDWVEDDTRQTIVELTYYE